MYQRIFRKILLFYFLLSYNGVQGEKMLSKLEDAKLGKQLKLLNKPSVKRVKTKYGEIYDCVDFYKQPAFDHPLLKDHQYHPKIQPTLSGRKQNSLVISKHVSPPTIWSKDGGCPSGTVPIKRITKDDLIRHKRLPPPEHGISHTKGKNNSDPERSYRSLDEYVLAVGQTPYDYDQPIFGAGMTTLIWNPHVEGQQHSACRLKIQNGLDTIQVGWRVDPTLYNDTKTRRFIHFQTGGSGCFNTLCPGFVITRSDIPLDFSYEGEISTVEGPKWENRMYIERDSKTTDWWLYIEDLQVGFWPGKIFPGLVDHATHVEWGGVVYSPPPTPKPPMGSGYFAGGEMKYQSYVRGLAISNSQERFEVDGVDERLDNHNMYDIKYKVISNGLRRQNHLFYGGPGGDLY